jgi:hypothetical protein
MKTLRLIAWLSGAVAALLIIAGSLSLVFRFNIIEGVNHSTNYFHAANSFLLVAIALLLAEKRQEK